MQNLGDFNKGDPVIFFWPSSGANGASITRSTNGTIVARVNGSATEITTGITDSEDFDGDVGVHKVEVATTDAAYLLGAQVEIVVQSATIDTKVVSAPLARFTINQKTAEKNPIGIAQAGAASSLTLPAGASAVDDFYNGQMAKIVYGTGAGQARYGTDYNGTTKVLVTDPPWATTPDATSHIVMFESAPSPVTIVPVVALATDAITSAALATSAVSEIVAAIFARPFHATKMGGLTFEETIAAAASALLAKLSGAATTTVAIRNVGDTADAITATVDADGNRSAVAVTLVSLR